MTRIIISQKNPTQKKPNPTNDSQPTLSQERNPNQRAIPKERRLLRTVTNPNIKTKEEKHYEQQPKKNTHRNITRHTGHPDNTNPNRLRLQLPLHKKQHMELPQMAIRSQRRTCPTIKQGETMKTLLIMALGKTLYKRRRFCMFIFISTCVALG